MNEKSRLRNNLTRSMFKYPSVERVVARSCKIERVLSNHCPGTLSGSFILGLILFWQLFNFF